MARFQPALRPPRTSAHHRRGFASLVERLEDRSVPSGLGNLLSSLTTGLQVTIINVERDLVPPSHLGGPVVAALSSSPAFDLAVGVVVSAAPLVPEIGVEVGSHAEGKSDPDSDTAEASSGLSIDVPGVISLSVGLPPVVSGVGNFAAGLVGTVGDALTTITGVESGDPGGSGPGDGGGGIAIGGGSGLGGTGISITHSGISLTLPGLAVGVSLPLSAPSVSNGGSPVPVPSPVSTLPALPGGPAGLATSPSSPGGSPLASLPTISHSPGGSAGVPAVPPSEDGTIANPPSAQGSLVSGAPSVATGAAVDRIDARQPRRGRWARERESVRRAWPQRGTGRDPDRNRASRHRSGRVLDDGVVRLGDVVRSGRGRGERCGRGPGSSPRRFGPRRPVVRRARTTGRSGDRSRRTLARRSGGPRAGARATDARVRRAGRGPGRTPHAIRHARDVAVRGDAGPGLRGHPSLGAPATAREIPRPDRIFRPARPVLSPEGVSVRATWHPGAAGAPAIA